MSSIFRHLIHCGWMGLVASVAWGMTGCMGVTGNEVVVYVTTPQVCTEPLLQEFGRENKIVVKAYHMREDIERDVFARRVIDEQENPHADVYWANSPIRNEQLKMHGVLEPYRSMHWELIPAEYKDPEGYWAGFAANVAVIMARKDMKNPPHSVRAFQDASRPGQAVLSKLDQGWMKEYMAALALVWGKDDMNEFLSQVRRNDVMLSSHTVRSAEMVAAGRADFTLVGTENVISRIRSGKAVSFFIPDQGPEQVGTWVMPNAVSLIKNARHPESAKKLIDFLLSPATEKKMAEGPCARIPLKAQPEMPGDLPDVGSIKQVRFSYTQVAKQISEWKDILKEW